MILLVLCSGTISTSVMTTNSVEHDVRASYSPVTPKPTRAPPTLEYRYQVALGYRERSALRIIIPGLLDVLVFWKGSWDG